MLLSTWQGTWKAHKSLTTLLKPVNSLVMRWEQKEGLKWQSRGLTGDSSASFGSAEGVDWISTMSDVSSSAYSTLACPNRFDRQGPCVQQTSSRDQARGT